MTVNGLVVVLLLLASGSAVVPAADSVTSPKTFTVVQPDWLCNFDAQEWCGFSQDPSDVFDWNRAKGRLPHTDTGPQSGDHTTGNDYYAFINASLPRRPGDIARIISPTFTFESHCTKLSFWFYGLGNGLGSLTTRIGSPNDTFYGNWSIVFRTNGPDSRKEWRRYQTTILSETTFRLLWEGVTGVGYQGDYAIDDIEVTSVPCPMKLNLDLPKSGWAIMFNISRDDLTTTTRPAPIAGPNVQTTKPPSKPDEFPIWAIALLVIGSFFVMATIFMFIIRYFRKRKGNAGQKYAAKNGSTPNGNSNIGNSAGSSSSEGTASTSMRPAGNHRPSLSSDNSFELPTKRAISVAVERRVSANGEGGSQSPSDIPKSARTVRFQTDYDTEYGGTYGFGLKLPPLPPLPPLPSLTPVPKELEKEAEKIDKQAEKRKRARSKLSVRQRRRLRLAAKMAQQMSAKQPGAPGQPMVSILPNGEKFITEPGKRKPIPLPPQHILDMMLKMRSPNNPMNALNPNNPGPSGVPRRLSAPAERTHSNAASTTSNVSLSNSVTVLVEPNRRTSNFSIEDVSDEDYGDYDDDDDDDELEDVDEDDDGVSTISTPRWEPKSKTDSGKGHPMTMNASNFSQQKPIGSGLVPVPQRNQVNNVGSSHSHNHAPVQQQNSRPLQQYNNQLPQQPLPRLPPGIPLHRPQLRPQTSVPQGGLQLHHVPVSKQTSDNLPTHTAPPGLYDGLDDDDD